MKEKFIEENQTLFDNLVDAAESLAKFFIQRSEYYIESDSLRDLQTSPLWTPFLISDCYELYNQLDKKLQNFNRETPGEAFNKLRASSIRYNTSTNSRITTSASGE